MKIDKPKRIIEIGPSPFNGLGHGPDTVVIAITNKESGGGQAVTLTADEFYGLVAAGRTVFNGGREPHA